LNPVAPTKNPWKHYVFKDFSLFSTDFQAAYILCSAQQNVQGAPVAKRDRGSSVNFYTVQ